jgi:hypothetical protein
LKSYGLVQPVYGNVRSIELLEAEDFIQITKRHPFGGQRKYVGLLCRYVYRAVPETPFMADSVKDVRVARAVVAIFHARYAFDGAIAVGRVVTAWRASVATILRARSAAVPVSATKGGRLLGPSQTKHKSDAANENEIPHFPYSLNKILARDAICTKRPDSKQGNADEQV